MSRSVMDWPRIRAFSRPIKISAHIPVTMNSPARISGTKAGVDRFARSFSSDSEFIIGFMFVVKSRRVIAIQLQVDVELRFKAYLN